MEYGCHNGFIVASRAEQIEDFALDAFEEIVAPTINGWDTLDDDQRAIVLVGIEFGARVACTVLGETGTYEQEYQTMLGKLQAQMKG